jgi:polyvinyl alcohol dehydrogenase (cytochrome)
MYLRDIMHTSFNPAETVLNRSNVTSLEPKWQLSLGNTIASGITVVNGVAYVGDWNGFLSAINVADGTIRWQTFIGLTHAQPDCGYPEPTGVSSQSVVHNGIVYVGGGDAAVYALDAASGAIVGRLPLGDEADGVYIWSSLMVYRNTLYVGISSFADCPLVRGGLARIDLSNPAASTVKYLMPPGRVGAGVWLTPAFDVASNAILVTTGTGEQEPAAGVFGGTLLKLDADSLNLQGFFLLPTNSTDHDIEWGSSPTLVPTGDGRTLVLATGKDGILYALDLQTLSPAWQTTLAIGGACPQCGNGSLSTPAFDGQRVYVGAGTPPDETGPGSLYALEPSTGAVVWMTPLDGTVIAPVTVANGVVYAATLSGLQVFDTATGTSLWHDPTGTAQYGQVAVADGVIYAGYVDGSLIARTVSLLPALTLELNGTSFRAGDTLVLRATVIPGPGSPVMDGYIALQVPDQTQYFLQANGGLTPLPQPLVANWSVTSVSAEIFRYTFSGSEPTGGYTWLGAFAVPGTGNVLGNIARASFTFSP